MSDENVNIINIIQPCSSLTRTISNKLKQLCLVPCIGRKYQFSQAFTLFSAIMLWGNTGQILDLSQRLSQSASWPITLGLFNKIHRNYNEIFKIMEHYLYICPAIPILIIQLINFSSQIRDNSHFPALKLLCRQAESRHFTDIWYLSPLSDIIFADWSWSMWSVSVMWSL